VISNAFAVARRHHQVSLGAEQHAIDGREEILRRNSGLALPGRA